MNLRFDQCADMTMIVLSNCDYIVAQIAELSIAIDDCISMIVRMYCHLLCISVLYC